MKTQTFELFVRALEALEAKVARLEVAASGVPSAQAIVGSVLEATGQSEAWADGSLDGMARLEVLHEVRLAGRRWFREQAQAVLDELTVDGEKSLFGRAKAAIGAFFDKANKYVRELTVAGMMVVAGPGPMIQQEAIVEKIDQAVAIQAQHLAEFQQKIVSEAKPLNGTFVSNAELYGASVWPSTQAIVVGVSSGWATEARRVHVGKDRPCDPCVAEEKRGWVPIADCLPIGHDTPCGNNCHCHILVREYKGGPEYMIGSGPYQGQFYRESSKSPYAWCVWDAVLKKYTPCRDERGRFASCGGSAGQAKPKPGEKPKPGSGGGKKPRKPRKPKESGEAKPAKPKKEPKPKKPSTEKPPKEQKPKEPKTPKEPKKPAEKPNTSADKPKKPAVDKPDKLRSNFGPSKAKVEVDSDLPDGAAHMEKARRILGPHATDEDLASITGAPDNAKVTVTSGSLFDPENTVNLHVKSPEMGALRQLERMDNGDLVIKNTYFYAEATGTGLGTKVFGREVEQAIRLGATKIKTEAARGVMLNGYITWPKLGYDAPIPDAVKSKLPKALESAKNISDLMRTKRGTDFWTEHGVTTWMEFDLKPGSKSRKHLEKYLKRKGLAE